MTLDHVNEDGKEHREKLVREGLRRGGIYQWLFKNRFPDDFKLQVLCRNCNWLKHIHYIHSRMTEKWGADPLATTAS